MQGAPPDHTLPEIPTLDSGREFAMATLLADEPRAHAMIDHAIGRLPVPTLRMLDALSRQWLRQADHHHLDEIDAIAGRLRRPGAYFLSVNYEWGCTVGVGAAPSGRSARLVRTLDWITPGLGRYVMAAKVRCPTGPFITLTWPGFTGVLQGMAPGRFAAAINQAPMRKLGGGVYPLDWAANRIRVWRSRDPMPAHLLRRAFETAPDYASARRLLTETRIAAPAIFTLSGMRGHETCAIERTETSAHVIDGRATVGNHWQSPDWSGRDRGIDSHGRTRRMRTLKRIELDPAFPWLAEPLLNPMTRLAMVADAAEGRLVAQGIENCRPVTRPLIWPDGPGA